MVLIRDYWSPLLKLAGLAVALDVANDTLLSYMPTYLATTIGLTTDESLVVPMFLLMSTNMVGAIVGFAVLGLLYVPQPATVSATLTATFPTPVRFAGFAIANNVSTSLFRGTAPAVNDWLVSASSRHSTADPCLATRWVAGDDCRR